MDSQILTPAAFLSILVEGPANACKLLPKTLAGIVAAISILADVLWIFVSVRRNDLYHVSEHRHLQALQVTSELTGWGTCSDACRCRRPKKSRKQPKLGRLRLGVTASPMLPLLSRRPTDRALAPEGNPVLTRILSSPVSPKAGSSVHLPPRRSVCTTISSML
ncbi:hypothetical protein KC325_g80 [Hortaea werneckii]|nr:hypothetical protein KC325_g80 [Hortaea werneckii]